MITFVKELIAAVAAWFRLQANRQERMGTDEMQRNARAKVDADIRKKATDAVQNNDLDEIRKQAGQ